ncbi:hypothetical protein AAHA92_02854 [Salvia divinorum]|uniref:Uncharacterized protein n=1 Tax=Salvia divinorum TaxID=28513 RepID=A0ABD1IF82_SALDI
MVGDYVIFGLWRRTYSIVFAKCEELIRRIGSLVIGLEPIAQIGFASGLPSEYCRREQWTMTLKFLHPRDGEKSDCYLTLGLSLASKCNGAPVLSKVAPHEIYRLDKCKGTTTSILSDETAQPLTEK